MHKYLKQVQVMCVAAGICGDNVHITAGYCVLKETKQGHFIVLL